MIWKSGDRFSEKIMLRKEKRVDRGGACLIRLLRSSYPGHYRVPWLTFR
jgi:hypothetical protein